MQFQELKETLIVNKLKKLIENQSKNIILIIIKKDKIGLKNNLLKLLKLMKIYLILKNEEFMIQVEKKLLMKLNKDKIKAKGKDKVLMVVHLILVVVVVLKVLILKIFLQVHLVVVEVEDNVDNKEVEVEEKDKIIFILKMMIKMIFNMEDKNKENKLT